MCAIKQIIFKNKFQFLWISQECYIHLPMWKSSTYSGRQQHLFSHWYDTDSERMVTTWIEVVTSPTWTVKNRLVKQLALRGIKHSANQIVGIGENSAGKILFLERGNANTGLQHIIYQLKFLL